MSETTLTTAIEAPPTRRTPRSHLSVRRFARADQPQWDAFVRSSKNGTFLFLRDYMEYHSHRFRDYSLIFSNERGRVVALLPANTSGETIISHEGLTYGGFISDDRLTATDMADVFEHAIEHLRNAGYKTLIYKSVPAIYHVIPADEDLYWLFRHGARLWRRDLLMVISYASPMPIGRRRRRVVRKAIRNIKVTETRDFECFWRILTARLNDRYSRDPVHSSSEIQMLAERFPDEIRLFAAYDGGVMQAGVVAYVSKHVCHVQYVAATEQGMASGAIDMIIHCLIQRYWGAKRFFDFGISTERDGRWLNEGLVVYKSGFGARTMVHDFYELRLD